jgi:hypothetical protein
MHGPTSEFSGRGGVFGGSAIVVVDVLDNRRRWRVNEAALEDGDRQCAGGRS